MTQMKTVLKGASPTTHYMVRPLFFIHGRRAGGATCGVTALTAHCTSNTSEVTCARCLQTKAFVRSVKMDIEAVSLSEALSLVDAAVEPLTARQIMDALKVGKLRVWAHGVDGLRADPRSEEGTNPADIVIWRWVGGHK